MEGIDTDRAQRASEIATLRAIAQEHLQEIGQQEEQERREEKEVQAVLAEENQRRTKNRQGSSAPEMDEEIEKGAKLRSAQGILLVDTRIEACTDHDRCARSNSVGLDIRCFRVCRWVPGPIWREQRDQGVDVAE